MIEVAVPEGEDKPYRCSEGFFLRIGPNSQQLTRDEILKIAIRGGKVRFDELFAEDCDIEKELGPDAIQLFRRQRNLPGSTRTADILESIGLTQRQKGKALVTRAALFFFGREPQRRFPEAFDLCPLR